MSAFRRVKENGCKRIWVLWNILIVTQHTRATCQCRVYRFSRSANGKWIKLCKKHIHISCHRCVSLHTPRWISFCANLVLSRNNSYTQMHKFKTFIEYSEWRKYVYGPGIYLPIYSARKPPRIQPSQPSSPTKNAHINVYSCAKKFAPF